MRLVLALIRFLHSLFTPSRDQSSLEEENELWREAFLHDEDRSKPPRWEDLAR